MAKSSHPGVTPYLKGSIFCVRLKLNGRDTRKSLATGDAGQADELCQLIWQIQQGQAYEYAKVPTVVREILGLKDPAEERSKEMDLAIEEVIPEASGSVVKLAELTDRYKRDLDY